MNIKKWLSRHRLFTATLLAASAYFLLAPLSDTLHYDFSRETFLVMHSLMESVSIIISFMCFGMVFHSYRLSRNDQNLFLGVTFLAVGLIDTMHALSYAGMPAFITENTVNKATQFWVSGRVVAATGFLTAAFVSKESGGRFARPYTMTVFAIAIAAFVFIGVIEYQGYFPAMFIPGKGLTPAKVLTEYLVACAMAVSGFMFSITYRRTHQEHLPFFVAAMAMLICSELFFTLYADPYDIYNFMGHMYKTLGYLLIYKMLFITSIQNPYAELTNAKEVLRDYVIDLEDAVKERTLELKSRNEELEHLNALKTDFLAMCSHDMKTPIQSTLLMLDLLIDEVDGSLSREQKEDLISIKKNQKNLHELIVNLLDLARGEMGGLILESEEVDLNKVLLDLREAYEGVAAKKGIEFRFDSSLETEDRVCMLDVLKFKQVVNNLASNALKFTPSGGRIEFSVEESGGDLMFRMFNSGEPILEDRLETIFERFIKSPGRPGDVGTGLGLSIAKCMVELHGGKIWARRVDGSGNEFCFTIPASLSRPKVDEPDVAEV